MKILTFLLVFIMSYSMIFAEDIIIHSNMTLDEALQGTKAPQEIIELQRLVDVEYYNFDGKLCRGQLVVHRDLVKDIQEAFDLIKRTKFPVKQCIPIVKYNWDDNASMSDDNTSAFNFRYIAGTKNYSNHAKGQAIDINPFENPAVYNDGSISPKGSKYDKSARGTILADSKITLFFKERGYRWGGDWTSLKDYQHFDKAD